MIVTPRSIEEIFYFSTWDSRMNHASTRMNGFWTSEPNCGRLVSYEGSSSSPHIAGSSPHSAADSSHSDSDAAHNDPILNDPDLLKITEASRTKSRLKPEETEQMIVELCHGRYLNFRQIGHLLGRDPRNTRDRFLSKMVQDGRLTARYPDEPTHPSQAYTTTEDAE